MLHGRHRECALIDELLSAACGGRSGVVVLRGEAGIGKSALLRYAADAATGIRLPNGSAPPSLPGNRTPTVPATGPSLPGNRTPALPGTGSPGLPGAGMPTLPGTGSPGLPGAGMPTLPGTGSPGLPGAGMRILRGTGIESESELPFAALHQLLRPVAALVGVLPARLADALRGAFGLGPAFVQDRFLISVAVLSLLAEAAEDGPLLCLIDDAHWLDGASADALTFAARRLDAEGIVILFAARPFGFPAPGLTELPLDGLDTTAAGALLAERSGVELPEAVRDSLVANTAGNPLALLELPGSLSADQLAGREALPDRLPVSAGVEQVFLDRARREDAPTQTLLLVAAAEDAGDLATVLRAAAALNVPAEALDAAERAGLVRVDGQNLTFCHPLVRTAVYRGATFWQRRDAQQALAGALDGPDAADRRAWHLAAAALGQDPQAAAELHRCADRARARGGHAAASAAYARAAALTAEPDQRRDRLTTAAEAAWQAGLPDHARLLLDQAGALGPPPLQRARIEHLRGGIEGTTGDLTAAIAILIGGAEPIAALDPVRAARMLTEAGQATWLAGDVAALHDVGRRLTALPTPDDAVPLSAQLVLGLDSLLSGDTAAAVRHLREAATHATITAHATTATHAGTTANSGADAHTTDTRTHTTTTTSADADAPTTTDARTTSASMADAHTTDTRARTTTATGAAAGAGPSVGARSDDIRAHLLAAAGAMFLGDDAVAVGLFTAATARARSVGAAAMLPSLLAPLSSLEAWTGRFATAQANATEGLRIAVETGQNHPAAHLRSVLAWIAAAAGREAECREHAAAALAHALGHRLGPAAGIASWALALLDLGSGRPAAARDRLEALASAGPGESHPMVGIFSAADLVEAAVRTDRPDLAGAARVRLATWTAHTGSVWGRALLARCDALLADDAEPHFAESLRLRGGRPVDAARTELLFGEWLRRRRRRSDARGHLRAAHEAFERLGLPSWADQASAELRATGETARKREPGTADQLTPQELQIVRIVGAGATNREVAAQLFLSPRTVDYHLRKVFTKLGVSSRSELIRQAAGSPEDW